MQKKLFHKINIHVNIFQKNQEKEFGPRLTEIVNLIGLQKLNLLSFSSKLKFVITGIIII